MNKKIFDYKSYEIINLFIRNSNKQMHGREIARNLKFNQKTTQNYLDLLEKSKILIKTESGKNHLYSINNNPIAESFLIIAENYKAFSLLEDFEIKEIIKDIAKQTARPIIIFGSYAKSYQTKHGDIDILTFDKIKDFQHKYAKKIHLLTADENNFNKDLLTNEPFPIEVINNHIAVQGAEFIIKLWLKKHGQA